MTSDSVRWGFIGAGFIASAALAPAVHRAAGAELEAAAARDRQRAESLEPKRAYSRYQDLLDDPNVEAVYISLTNDAHLPWIRAALSAGKHVLCEKPLTLDANECRDAQAAAHVAGLILVEATWMRWHPRYRRADALLGRGSSGSIRSVRSTFTFDGVTDSNYRLDAALGGGALLDLGPYVLAPAVDWCPQDWTSISGHCTLNERSADLTANATVSSPRTTADIHVSIVEAEQQLLTVTAEGLSIDWEGEPFTSWQSESWLALTEESRQWRESFEPCDAYQLMVEHVSRAIRGDEEAFLPSQSLSLDTARLIDDIKVQTGIGMDLNSADSVPT
ncbi:MAG: Gfo/Idh/MocA family protein [Actinomycetes bacterium]